MKKPPITRRPRPLSHSPALRLLGSTLPFLLATDALAAQLEVGPGKPYTTVQAAVSAALDGDVVNVAAGTYVEQVTITRNITLQGAGVGQTILRAPMAATLTQSGGNWKNLKAQDVFAVVGVKSAGGGPVTIRNLTVDGYDQGYLPDASYPGKMDYVFQGIGVYNSSATIDSVLVTGVRELASDYPGPDNVPPPGYPVLDQPSGMNHNEAIFAESAAGAGSHTVTISNSTITKFQKTAILAWGPTLQVNIDNNTIQGYGATLWSTGNGIQVASSDRSGLGGANGDRTGTTAVISNNRILDLGLVIPPPGEPGSYLNLGLAGPSGILLWEAGAGVQIRGNTITSTLYRPSWHSSATSNDGGWSSQGIDIVLSPNVVVEGNTVSGLEVGLIEEGVVAGSALMVRDNSFSNFVADLWLGGGNDPIVLGGGDQVIAYSQNQIGVDTVTGLDVGDAIYVIGFANVGGVDSVNGSINGVPVVDFTGGSVSAGDGSSVAARSVQVATGSGSTTLYIDTEADGDAPELLINLVGSYGPANFQLDGGKIRVVASAPAVTTGAASGVTVNGATLSGTVSSNGADTTVSFEYGTTTAYGSTAAAVQSPLGAKFAPDAVTASLSPLTCGTLYHFRAVATNAVGGGHGGDGSFTTEACPDTITGPGPGGDTLVGAVDPVTGWLFAPVGSGAAESGGFIPVTGHARSPAAAPPADYAFPYGLFDFVLIRGAAGSSAQVSLTLSDAVPPNAIVWQFGPTTDDPTPHWHQLAGAAVNGAQVTFTLQDGGAGDLDPATLSQIHGQVAVGLYSPTPVPTLGEWALLLLSGLLGALGLGRLGGRRPTAA